MQKKMFVMAALAVLCAAVPAFSAGTCQDWKGVWEFTYDNNTQVNICFDNTSITEDSFELCENDSVENCQCIDNITDKQICIDNATFAQCDNDSDLNCVCVPNPLYVAPSVAPGTYEVIITEVQENVTTGVALNCLATGRRTIDSKPIMIAQPAASFFNLPLVAPFNLDNDTYLVYEATFSADTANKPFSQILGDDFAGDNFTAREDFNPFGLVSGVKTGDLCQFTIVPNTVRKAFKFFNPIYPFVMYLDKDSAFDLRNRPVTIDWGTENIRTFFKFALTQRTLIGFAIARPFKLDAEQLDVTITNGDNATCYSTLTIK